MTIPKLSSLYMLSVNPIHVDNLCCVMNTCKDSFITEEYSALINAIVDELNTMEVDAADIDLPF